MACYAARGSWRHRAVMIERCPGRPASSTIGPVSGRGAVLRRLDGWLSDRPWVGDCGLALAAASLTSVSVPLVIGGRLPGEWAAVTLADLGVLHLAVVGRRMLPRLSFAVVALAELLLVFVPTLTTGGPGQTVVYSPVVVPSSAVFLLALYAASAYAKRPAANVALWVGILGCVLVMLSVARTRTVQVGMPSLGAGALVFGGALLAAVLATWYLGRFRRMRDSYVAALEERAVAADARRVLHEEAATRRERNRIASEVHDVVAHSLAVIVRQAEAGEYTFDSDPAVARQMLAAVAKTGRAALTDMRGLLGVLRKDDEPVHETGPQPVLADLPALLDRVGNTGLRVSMRERGTRIPLDLAGELAVYRVVQEALTNVVKHAGANATAVVRLNWQPTGVQVIVRDSGGSTVPSQQHPQAGYGLVGLRERLQLLGGNLTAEPDGQAAFVVRGWLPAPAEPTTEAD